MPAGVPSPENPLFPEIPGYTYGTVLPFVQRQQAAQPVQGTDESGRVQSFVAPRTGFALPEVLRSSLNELTSALTLPGRAFKGQVPQADMNRQAVAASLALMGAGVGVNSLTGETAGSAMGTIKGFHGTPHKFEPVEHNPFGEFKQEAIGTGEGNATYGHGHYIAGNPSTAETYKTNLSENKFINKVKDSYDSLDAPEDAHIALKNNPDLSKHEKTLLDALAKDDWLGFEYPHQAVQAAIREPGNFDLSPETQKALKDFGSLYHVEVKPGEHQLLDWDKTLAEQAPEVKSKVTKLLPPNASVGENATGEDLYNYFSAQARRDALAKNPKADIRDSKALTSQFLHDKGIPGIKYLDKGSRGKTEAEQTRNYVVFHKSNLKVTGRNGEELTPVDHDPFNPGGKRVFTAAEQAKGRETPVSQTGPRTQESGITVQVLDRNLGAMDVNSAAYGGLKVGGTPMKPSALAMESRRLAEENIDKAKKKQAHKKAREAAPVKKEP